MADQHWREVGEAVGEAVDAGLSVIWPNEDGSKRPEGAWKDAQDKPRSRDELRLSFKEKDRSGLMVVCGKVSGNLEVLDFESADIYATFQAAMSLAGEEDLLERIETGYQERCPRGGYHLPYRCEVVGGNQKLAFDENLETLIETRGEGGCFMAAPTRFNGSAWTRMRGSFTTIARVTTIERDTLHRVARLLSRAPVVVGDVPVYEPKGATGDRPGDDFNRRGNWGFLLQAGWTVAGLIGDQQYWRRPNKDWQVHKGHSAVLHLDTDVFVPFSSSTPFPVTQVGYGKFTAYAFLLHDGDFSAAAKALIEEGFGRPKAPLILPPDGDEFGGMRGDHIFDLEIPDIEHLPVLGQDGFIMAGAANLLYAFPKAGKTELTAGLLREWLEQEYSIVYLSEEPLFFWRLRFEEMSDAPTLWERAMFYPAMGWGIAKTLRLIEKSQADILVIDTLRYTLGYQEAKGDEDVARVVIPVIQAARERGMTLVALYHARKMPGENGTDISGHHSLYGAFDRAVQLRRIDGDENERKRRLVVSGRLLDPMGTTKLTYIMRDSGDFQALDTASIVGFEKVCEVCSKPFRAKRSMARFCGPTCRQRSHRKDES